MYTIHVDGELLFSTALEDTEHAIISPMLSMGIDDSGTLSFTLPPCNHLHGAIRKRMSIITVEQDGTEIFRGQVLDDESDSYNQKQIYAEGDKTFLLNSQIAPYTYTGTIVGLLEKLIEEHNGQVEPEKQFTVGEVTAVDAEETIEDVKCAEYWDTLSEIKEKLLGYFGGYLKTRSEAGVRYIDWLKEYGGVNPQEIRFGVNLLDIRSRNDTSDLFTVLIPLGSSDIGADGEFIEPVSIASVNDDKNYIQDDEAVALYGRIWRTNTWENIDDPEELLEKGREYMKIGAALNTLTLKAVDMHFIDGDVDAIRVGDKVHVHSEPNGVDVEKVCAQIEIDLINPENTVYTFGVPPMALSEYVVAAEEDLAGLTGVRRGGGGGGGRRSVEEEAKQIIRWAKVNIDQANANILLSAGEINALDARMNTAEIEIDGLNAQILLKASTETVTDLERQLRETDIIIDALRADINLKADALTVNDLTERMTSAEADIDGLDAAILLKADAMTVTDLEGRVTSAEADIDGLDAAILLKADATITDALGQRISSAEVEIDGLDSEISLKADKITLDGYVTADELSAEVAKVDKFFSGDATAAKMVVTNLTALKFTCEGNSVEWDSQEVVTSVSGKSGGAIAVRDADGNIIGTALTSYSVSASKKTIYFLSW